MGTILDQGLFDGTASATVVAHHLGVDLSQGLGGELLARRQGQFGPNELPPHRSPSLPFLFLGQFKSPLIYLLIGAATLLFFVHNPADTAVIMTVILFNATVGTIQEGRARQSLAVLHRLTQPTARVIRAGKEMIIAARDLVPGDVILIQEGEKVPADLRLFEATQLTVNQALFTGESFPVPKSPSRLVNRPETVFDQANMVFLGSLITRGHGAGLAVATGSQTELGRITHLAEQFAQPLPLEEKVQRLMRLGGLVILAALTLTFILGLASGKDIGEMFALAVSLAVSALPEGLPAVLTIILALGVTRMARREAIVKKMAAVEALSSLAVIATDKTGTLTKNQLAVTQVVSPAHTFLASGAGYSPKGSFSLGGATIKLQEYPDLGDVLTTGLLCQNTTVEMVDEAVRLHGDPTEASLIIAATKAGLSREAIDRDYTLIEEIPFDPKRRFMAVIHRHGADFILSAKGAPEVILDHCRHWSDGRREHRLHGITRSTFERQFEQLAHAGLRVLALARGDQAAFAHSRLPPTLTFLGFVGIEDALNPNVQAAIAQAKKAGVRVVMVTGDYPTSAKSLAQEAGIYTPGDTVLTGADLRTLSPGELGKKLATTTVFARITPEDKLTIVKAYQGLNQPVAMTGDGVNDAPALAAANLGIAMGQGGTEVAQEEADIVLKDNNFATIVAALAEGRNIVQTLKKVLLYLLSTSFGEVLFILATLVSGFPLALLPAQIVWMNLVTDGFLDVSLAAEAQDKTILRKSWAKEASQLIDRSMIIRLILMGLTMALGGYIVFATTLAHSSLAEARSVALITLSAYQWLNAFNCRFTTSSILHPRILTNRYLIISLVIITLLQLLAIYEPFFQQFLGTVALPAASWLTAFLFATTIILVDEVYKLTTRISTHEERQP